MVSYIDMVLRSFYVLRHQPVETVSTKAHIHRKTSKLLTVFLPSPKAGISRENVRVYSDSALDHRTAVQHSTYTTAGQLSTVAAQRSAVRKVSKPYSYCTELQQYILQHSIPHYSSTAQHITAVQHSFNTVEESTMRYSTISRQTAQ